MKDLSNLKKFAQENHTDEAVAMRGIIDKEYSQEFRSISDPEKKAALAKEAVESLRQHSRLATEEGRAVQANILLGKKTPEGMLRDTQRMIDDFNKGKSAKIRLLTSHQTTTRM
jgi:hypothetical protein